MVMRFDGFRDYRRREYCNAIECQVQVLLNSEAKQSEKYEETRKICKSSCTHTTYEFHHWLIDNDFLIVKPEDSNESTGGI